MWSGGVIRAEPDLVHDKQPTVKIAMKGLMRLREASAEFSERMQDLYAEAQAEYTADMLEQDDGQDSHGEDSEQGR